MQYQIITAIVPKLPPAIDGLGDYGFYLAQQLHQDHGWKTNFIVGDPTWVGASKGDFFGATSVEARSRDALKGLLPAPPAIVLLHYVGHGYAPRGCPTWLVNALIEWCQSGGRLVTMFHELYATRPLLSSASLTSPMQKWLATQLIQISDRCLTSRQNYADKIRRLSRQKHSETPALPIFSNVGELSEPQPLVSRFRRLVVFGGMGPRLRVYQRSRAALEQICHELQIEEVIDIGPKLDLSLKSMQNVPITQLGIQPAHKISRELATAIAGFLDYPITYLGKSGIFAAYCAHGVVPIAASYSLPSEDGLVANKQYWVMNRNIALDLEKGQAIANSAYAWYQAHNLKAQSQIIHKLLQG